jgi:Fe-S cluster biogenesis protein NfuA/nitrite reductase/ring-hydroxylating ferredoxin subunit
MNATLSPTQSQPRFDGTAPIEVNGVAGRPPESHGDVHHQGRRIQDLIERIESLPDLAAREMVRDCLQSVLALHGDGLARILQLLKNAGAAGQELTGTLLRDKLVRGLLLIHDLHPVPLEARLREALEKIRPYMQSHGGGVELIELADGKARLRLEGTCKSCPSSSVTLELAVRQAVEEACPDLLSFEVDGASASSPAPDHLPAPAPSWTVLDDFGDLQDGAMRPLQVAAVPVLFLKAGGHLYAYRNHCPACEASLDAGVLESKMLSCRRGHRFDVQRAGLSPDNPEIHLEPFPLLAAGGRVKISVR